MSSAQSDPQAGIPGVDAPACRDRPASGDHADIRATIVVITVQPAPQ